MADGLILGPKAKFTYVDDDGNEWYIQTLAGLGNVEGTGLTEIEGNPTVPKKPSNIRARFVHWNGNEGKIKKKLICAPDGTLYKSNTSGDATVDGVAGVTTGRIGEKVTF